MRYLINIFMLLLLLPGPLPGQDEPDDYLMGIARLSEGRYEEAVTCLTNAIAKNQDRDEYFLRRAECLYQLGDYSGALSDLEHTGNKDIGSLLTACCYARMGEVEQCISYMDRHLRSAYKQPESVILLDPAFTGMENQKQWKELWRREWYDDVEKLAAEANYLIGRKAYIDALELFSQNAEVVNSRHGLLALRAEVFFRLGNLNNCITDLSAAIEKNTGIPGYYIKRAEAYAIQGKQSKAIQDYTRALQLNPYQFTVHYARSQSYKALNDYEKAGEDMEFLVRYFPDNEKFLYETGRIHYLNNSYLSALKHFNKLLQLSADSAIYFQARGETYLATRIYKYAIMDFSMALDLDPVNNECYLKKGLARFHLGDTEGACIDWDKARRYGSEEAENLLIRHCK